MIDGFQFIELFSNTFPIRYKQTKLVILTSSVSPQDKERAMSISNKITFLNKPLTQEALEQI